jgi:hypothetical protein
VKGEYQLETNRVERTFESDDRRTSGEGTLNSKKFSSTSELLYSKECVCR